MVIKLKRLLYSIVFREATSILYLLLQGIFPTQGLNPGLLLCRQILYHLSHRGSSYHSQKYLKTETKKKVLIRLYWKIIRTNSAWNACFWTTLGGWSRSPESCPDKSGLLLSLLQTPPPLYPESAAGRIFESAEATCTPGLNLTSYETLLLC